MHVDPRKDVLYIKFIMKAGIGSIFKIWLQYDKNVKSLLEETII